MVRRIRPGDAGHMTETHEPKKLERSRDERMLAGVCGGIAKYLNVDPTVVRLATVLMAFVGGAGILVYVAGWLLMPEEAESTENQWHASAA